MNDKWLDKWLTCSFYSGAIHEEINKVAYNRVKCPTCNTEYPYPLREIQHFVDGKYITSYEESNEEEQ